MPATSRFPYGSGFARPFGLASDAAVDVNRIGALALLGHPEAQESDARGGDDE